MSSASTYQMYFFSLSLTLCICISQCFCIELNNFRIKRLFYDWILVAFSQMATSKNQTKIKKNKKEVAHPEHGFLFRNPYQMAKWVSIAQQAFTRKFGVQFSHLMQHQMKCLRVCLFFFFLLLKNFDVSFQLSCKSLSLCLFRVWVLFSPWQCKLK